jgi:flagellar hook-basal body complex protein FliE
MQIQNDSPLNQHIEKLTKLLNRVGERSNPSVTSESSPFSDMLVGGLQRVNDMQNSAESQMEQLITGGDVNQAEVFTSVQKADMSFRMLVQIRNKLMQAYEEINSIRV